MIETEVLFEFMSRLAHFTRSLLRKQTYCSGSESSARRLFAPAASSKAVLLSFVVESTTEGSLRTDNVASFVLVSKMESADAIDPAFLSLAAFFFFLRLPINFDRRLEGSSVPASPLVAGRLSGVESTDERPLLRVETA